MQNLPGSLTGCHGFFKMIRFSSYQPEWNKFYLYLINLLLTGLVSRQLDLSNRHGAIHQTEIPTFTNCRW